MTSLLIILVSLLTCCGQLCQKQAVENWRHQSLSWQAKLLDRWLLAGIGSLGLGMAVWLIVLQYVPLSIAYPMLSLNFVLVTLVARFWFGEQTHWRGWAGIVCIMLGVILMGAHQ
ncbi:4-amino-4-deoxy-L-arabinose-phosphoundecaprenol flippase subunit ArnE [Tolumonas lignilytica]|jgi:Membrane transporters of cations and cationic drugs|uniref:4-amino-4-deoxy-L-arabinose-phosphoundecaprenol flippase subunit ArnE n=1 Tax=Tolumonas lignilytica TaxID=1283284 RepID=UPI000467D337|nr:4-amino-4-deoxy-L-arabinose-phosphoundecaprenol flippase subunit ArnE [Tolumonas lignilytica]